MCSILPLTFIKLLSIVQLFSCDASTCRCLLRKQTMEMTKSLICSSHFLLVSKYEYIHNNNNIHQQCSISGKTGIRYPGFGYSASTVRGEKWVEGKLNKAFLHLLLYGTLTYNQKCSKQLAKNEENACSNGFQYILWLIMGTRSLPLLSKTTKVMYKCVSRLELDGKVGKKVQIILCSSNSKKNFWLVSLSSEFFFRWQFFLIFSLLCLRR